MKLPQGKVCLGLGVLVVSLPFLMGQSCFPTFSAGIVTTGTDTKPSITVTVNPTDYGGSWNDVLEGKTAIFQATDSSYYYYSSAATYEWTQLDGPAVELRGSNTEACSFVAPSVDEDTQITLMCTATNDAGSSSSQAVVNILDTATQIPAPVAEATYQINNAYFPGSGNAETDASVTLQGSAHPQGYGTDYYYSYYDNGNVIQDYVSYSYFWEQISGPGVQLSADDIASPSFVAPAVDTVIAVNFRLTATDSEGRTASTTVAVNIDAVPPPLAQAQAGAYGGGYYQNTGYSAKPYERVVLSNGGYSNISFGNTGPYSGLTFLWEQLSGPAVTLANAATPVADFRVPCVLAQDTAIIQVTVTDRLGRTATSTVDVLFTPMALPYAYAGGDLSYTNYYYSGSPPSLGVPDVVQLAGTGYNGDSSNTNAPIFLWEQLEGPATVTIQDGDHEQAYFLVPEDGNGDPVYGDYVFRFTVTDSCGASKTDLIAVSFDVVDYR